MQTQMEARLTDFEPKPDTKLSRFPRLGKLLGHSFMVLLALAPSLVEGSTGSNGEETLQQDQQCQAILNHKNNFSYSVGGKEKVSYIIAPVRRGKWHSKTVHLRLGPTCNCNEYWDDGIQQVSCSVAQNTVPKPRNTPIPVEPAQPAEPSQPSMPSVPNEPSGGGNACTPHRELGTASCMGQCNIDCGGIFAPGVSECRNGCY